MASTEPNNPSGAPGTPSAATNQATPRGGLAGAGVAGAGVARARAAGKGAAREGTGGTNENAAHEVVRHDALELRVPLLGHVDVNPRHATWYAAVAALAVLEIIDWPVAAVLAVGKALADNHRYHLLEEFGRALDEVAA